MIKFTTSNIPSFVQQDFLLDDKETKEQIIGYLIQTDNGSIRVEEGDYIEENSGNYTVYKASEYASHEVIKEIVHERIGKKLVIELYSFIDELKLTDEEEHDLIQRLTPAFVCLSNGLVARARKGFKVMESTPRLTTIENSIMDKINNALNNL